MPEEQHHHDEDLTTNTMERWEYIGTLLSGVILVSLPAILIGAGVGVISLSVVTQPWMLLYSIVTLMAATWTWGKETLEAVQKARGK